MKTPEEFSQLIATVQIVTLSQSQKVSNWAHLNGSGIWGQCSRAQVASQQRVEWRAEWRACCPPVSLQVLSQVFTCILQLVLIQNDVKHLLRWSRQRRLRLPLNKLHFMWTMPSLTDGHWASFSAATSCTFRYLLWDFPLDLISRCNTCRQMKGNRSQILAATND